MNAALGFFFSSPFLVTLEKLKQDPEMTEATLYCQEEGGGGGGQ